MIESTAFGEGLSYLRCKLATTENPFQIIQQA
jgi:hypothetical protein